MTNGEAVIWLINIAADIGKAEHRDLWHYEQALCEIREMLESAQPEHATCYLDSPCEYQNINIALPTAQPERSLWFRIGEICVDESKGFISSGRAVEKIRELLKEERREE